MYEYFLALIFLIIFFFITIGYTLYCFGFFQSVVVRSGPSPFKFNNQRIVYKLEEGSYGYSSQTFTELVSLMPKGVSVVTFGIYVRVDDELLRRHGKNPPEMTDDGRFKRLPVSIFRSDELEVTQFNPKTDHFYYTVGAVIEKLDLTKEQKKLLHSKGYRYRELPSEVKHAVFSSFPYSGMLSTVVGARKVYPALVEYIQERRLCAYPVVEMYEDEMIHYIVPLSEQENFIGLLETPEEDEGVITNDEDEMDEEYTSESGDYDEDDEEDELLGDEEGSDESFEEL